MTQNIKDSFGRESIDEHATITAAKHFLNDFTFWRLQLKQLEHSQRLRYLTSTASEPSAERAQRIDLECRLRSDTLSLLSEDSNKDVRYLANILRLRFIKGYSVTMICRELLISERSFTRHQNKALFVFALACPLAQLAVFKSSSPEQTQSMQTHINY